MDKRIFTHKNQNNPLKYMDKNKKIKNLVSIKNKDHLFIDGFENGVYLVLKPGLIVNSRGSIYGDEIRITKTI
ncbi:hypothetical protein QVN60_07110 [Yersinia aleksiciae]|uniref:hypothetical protein n=2 Tax=Yersinia aleksiciae TaxID=263819 RepID=UPI0011A34C8A|nr:hypothetical protein [Yersinia aleksiciae]MDN0122961.1 hypothetical protein [Yersinia aleksiciae]